MDASACLQACSAPLPLRARQGIVLLNDGFYFEAHEALEDAWRQETAPIRDLYRGLLQAAVVYLHASRGRYAGAVKVYERCVGHLRPWAPLCQGVDVARLLADLQALRGEIERLGPDGLSALDPIWLRSVTLVE